MREGDRVLFTSKEVGLAVEAVPNEIHVSPTQVLLFGVYGADFRELDLVHSLLCTHWG